MRSEKNRSTLSRPIATAMILLASGMACSLAMAEPAAQAGHIKGVQIKGQAVQSVMVDDLQAVSSQGTVTSINGIKTPYVFNNQVIVQATDWSAVQAVISGMQGVQLGQALGNRGRFHVVETPSVGAAFEVQRALTGIDGVLNVEVDSGKVPTAPQYVSAFKPQNSLFTSKLNGASVRNGRLDARSNIGVIPVDSGSNPNSIPSTQWHFVNGSIPQHDNNILESIYSTDLLTGAGVTIGYASINNRIHLDVDHTELTNIGGRTGGYQLGLSQIFDPILDNDDVFMTGEAGILVAERNSPVTINDLQGVSPGATLASLFRGPTPLFESQGYEWKMDTIDIKVHQLINEFDFPGAGYNENRLDEFVSDSFKNSVRLGRGRKGTIHVFGTGSSFDFFNNRPTNKLADPYNFTPEPWDVFGATTNQIGVSLSNGFVSGPFYVGGQTHQYPPANDRTSLIMNIVSEDGNIDTLGAVGPGVFASVYAGSGNEGWTGSQAISGRGIATIVAGTQPPGSVSGEGPLGLLPAAGLVVIGNTTGESITGGIIALMLEANPSLKVRDIQHIFFESIQESMRSPANKWPNFTSSRFYYSPGAGQTSNSSFWQANTGFYNNATPPLTVPPTDAVVNQAIRHSDQYGFGVVDANLAIQKAKSWAGTSQLMLLDTGIVGDVNVDDDTPDDNEARVPVEIEDATFSDAEPEANGSVPVITGAATLIPGPFNSFSFCIRQNLKIESIVIELTIEGMGSNDLYIDLQSPTGTRSILALPTTINLSGMSTDDLFDDELDLPFGSGEFNGTEYAYYQHPFLTHKHWGELSGGTWQVNFADFGPDTANPEGAEPGADLLTEPGADLVIDLGELGIPGSTVRGPKTVTAFRIKVYGTEIGAEPFLGCAPGATSCPGDLNGDGRIDLTDLHLFLSWYQSGDLRADLSGNGSIDFGDIQAFLGIFQPGFCTTADSPFTGGRPIPGSQDPSDNNPPTRPI